MSGVESNRPVVFMRRAIELAMQSVAGGGGPFGALVVRDGAIVGEGQNQVTRHNDPTAHAEISAIREACAQLATFRLQGCELFTSCEPCPMCLGAILWARLDRIWFGAAQANAAASGFDDRAFYKEFAKPIEARRISMQSLLAEEAQVPFDVWQAAPSKTLY